MGWLCFCLIKQREKRVVAERVQNFIRFWATLGAKLQIFLDTRYNFNFQDITIFGIIFWKYNANFGEILEKAVKNFLKIIIFFGIHIF